MFSAPSDAVLSSSFYYPGRRFLWSRLRLFENRIEMFGLGWTGLHRRTLLLDRVKRLRWWTGSGNINFALLLKRDDGEDERLYLHVDAAGLWKHEVEARAPNLDTAGPPLPKKAPSSASSSSSSSDRARAA
jgi:hypothetical protein